MKPERIEELAQTAFHLASPAHKWEFSHENWKDRYRDIARAIYAASMRDAAGVARGYPLDNIPKPDHGTWTARGAILAGFNIATVLEAIAKEASDAER